jgi:hypothetical protein
MMGMSESPRIGEAAISPALKRVRDYLNEPRPPRHLPKTKFSPVFSTIEGGAPTYPDLALSGSMELNSFKRYKVSGIFGLRLGDLRLEHDGLALNPLLRVPNSAK